VREDTEPSEREHIALGNAGACGALLCAAVVLVVAGGLGVKLVMIPVSVAFVGLAVTLLISALSLHRTARISLTLSIAVTLPSYAPIVGAGIFDVAFIMPISLPFLLFARRDWRIIVGLICVGAGVWITNVVMPQPSTPWISLTMSEQVALRAVIQGCVLGFMTLMIGYFYYTRALVTDHLAEALEEAQAGSKAKDAFLANISHEIRTPMNGVIGMLGLLADTSLDEKQFDYTDTARRSAISLLAIVNDILDLSKIESGQFSLEPRPFNLWSAVEEVLDMVAIHIQDRHIELLLHYAPEVPIHVVGDEGRIRQILINLVGNAAKFTAFGHILVQVSRAEGGAIRFAVEDTGIGIPKDKLEDIFEKFSQADASTTRRFGGTGLGLAISQELIQLMGGTLGVESEVGQGSTFWFEITLPIDTEAPSSPLPQAELSGIRVLIVDDHPVNRRILNELLGRWGITCGLCDSGSAALTALREGRDQGTPYDLAIVDFHMPEMDGLQLAEAIRGEPRLEELILVLLNSVSRQARLETLKPLGFASYLVKPAKSLEIYETLSALWGAKLRGEELPLITRHALAGRRNRYSPEAHTSARILLVEDNLINQRVASSILSNLGHRLDVASNGREAIELLELVSYDIVFMDLQMPEMDGFEATGVIREREATTGEHVPIIAMTAHAMTGYRERCLSAGMDEYISKPIRVEELATMVDRFAGRQAPRPRAAQGQPPPAPLDGTPSPTAAPINAPAVSAERPVPEPFHEVLSLTMGDIDVARGLIALFLSDTAEILEHMEEALRAEAGDLKRHAHTLKGSAGNMGLVEMFDLAKRLNQEDRREQERKLVGQMRAELGRLQDLARQARILEDS